MDIVDIQSPLAEGRSGGVRKRENSNELDEEVFSFEFLDLSCSRLDLEVDFNLILLWI